MNERPGLVIYLTLTSHVILKVLNIRCDSMCLVVNLGTEI